MKLCNKKTGEVYKLIEYGNDVIPHEIKEFVIETEEHDYKYNSLTGLFTFDEDNHRYVPIAQAYGIIDTMEYEPDSKPSEPLIKDEKIRKAVRAWAEAVDADSAFVEKWTYDGDQFVLSDELAEIHFRTTTPKEIKAYKRYTIAELCGENE